MFRARIIFHLLVTWVLPSVTRYKWNGIAAPAASLFDYSSQEIYNKQDQKDLTICYEELGCFTNNYPFYKKGSKGRPGYVPDSPLQIETKFLLYNTKDSYTIVNSSTAHCSSPVSETDFLENMHQQYFSFTDIYLRQANGQ